MPWNGAHGLVCLGACVILELGCQRTTGSSAEPSPRTTAPGDQAGAANDTPRSGGGSGGANAGGTDTETAGGEGGQDDSGTGGTTSIGEDAGAANSGGSASTDTGGVGSAQSAGGKPNGHGSHAGNTTGGGDAGARPAGGGTSMGGSAPAGGANTLSDGGALTASSGGSAAAGAGAGTTAGASAGGASAAGASTGGASAAGASTGGVSAAGASTGGVATATGGVAGTSSTATGGAPCAFDVTATTSSAIPTVGSVDWSTTLAALAHAEIVYTLDDAADGERNRGGSAPADVSSPHTLLLGLKPNRTYTFHLEATSTSGATCTSPDYHLTTGTLPNIPAITRTALDSGARAGGFIITTGGFGSSAPIAIVDADGSVVWTAPSPTSASRARFDYEAKTLWVLAANAQNGAADVRSISLDGLTKTANPSGLEHAHHDLVALPGGVIATFVWSKSGIDQESDLVALSPDGSVKTLFHIGANLYAGGQSADGGGPHSYHCNSLAYHPTDDSFTIGDRNPSLFVKVKRSGELQWQFGGSCSGAKATACVPGNWQVNHGHHLLDDGTFLFFNNTSYGSTSPSNADEFALSMSDTLHASSEKQWAGGGHEHSDTLGDVQRLPNGNTLVTFSNAGMIYELDSAWNVVQTLSASSFGYSEWRETLYGPPPR